MKRWAPWILAIGFALLGVMVVVVGFGYEVIYVGIPYQDPTPEMQARYQYHSVVAARTMWTGAGITLMGLMGCACLGIWQLLAASREG